MKRTVPRLKGAAKEAARGELIGRSVTVSAANDAGLVGLTGDIIDESLHTLTVRVAGAPGARRIQVPKAGSTFSFPAADGGDGQAATEIDGRAIQFRSEDRTKKVR